MLSLPRFFVAENPCNSKIIWLDRYVEIFEHDLLTSPFFGLHGFVVATQQDVMFFTYWTRKKDFKGVKITNVMFQNQRFLIQDTKYTENEYYWRYLILLNLHLMFQYTLNPDDETCFIFNLALTKLDIFISFKMTPQNNWKWILLFHFFLRIQSFHYFRIFNIHLQ